MSHDYDQLKTYPEEFVHLDKSSTEVKPEAATVPSQTPIPQAAKPELDQPTHSQLVELIPPLVVKSDAGIRNSGKKTIVEAVKLTQSGIVFPAGYVLFQETMQIILKHLKIVVKVMRLFCKGY